MEVYVLSQDLFGGLETIEGYIESMHDNGLTYHDYFKVQVDSSVNDYDYTDSQVTDEQEELLHDKILNNQYEMVTGEEHLYNYIHSLIVDNGKYYPNKIKSAKINGRSINAWINTKGYVHFITQTRDPFTDGKYHLCDTEFMFSKNRELKEVRSNIIL